MKRKILVLMILAITGSLTAAPLRIAVLDFENQAAVSSDSDMVGNIEPRAIAEKGVYLLGSVLANEEGFRLIDRRDFLGRIEPVPESARKKETAPEPSFLRAAQALNTDVVLRGALMSFAPGRQIVDQGGYRSEFVALSIRVALQALDTRDGTIIASADGAATRRLRQTDSLRIVLGEDEITDILRASIEDAVPRLNEMLQKRIARERARPKIKLSVRTSSDPALVELNGILIGTTPLMDFEVYKGDHILTVGKAGYRDVNKRIVLEADTSIEVPMLRTELTADELKEVLETMRMNVILGIPEPPLIINTIVTD